MNRIHSEFIKADNLLYEFAQKTEKFDERYTHLTKDITVFIEKNRLENKVILNEMALGYMLVDYFEDIRRLKTYHGIEHVNNLKIVAYTSYWFLKRKPIQIVSHEKELMYINERFILAYILNFLNQADEIPILSRENQGLKSFAESLFYFLKYKVNGPNNLEMILMAFFAGQIYQEKEEDLSDKVGKLL